MRTIGTAGHVDHGKSTLVHTLTGIDPDRLAEEKARELTIDLGFAWLRLSSGAIAGIIDVPGHRDFIENMLAGIGGIDLVILVIAADEGIMPQTREHLAIIDLLNIPAGIIALTKVDLIDDPEWLEIVELDIYDALAGTILAEAPLVHVSAHSGKGLPELIAQIESLLEPLPQHPDLGQPYLPIDRVFTVEGFGTVITGTLTGGSLGIGDNIEIQPRNITGRVRGLQSYKEILQRAFPGSRVAINLSGINRDSIRRGDVLTFPGQIQPTKLIDVQIRYLDAAQRPLKHNDTVKFFCGTAETTGRVRLLDREIVEPGQTAWAQIILEDALPLNLRERFIIRIPSPAETTGGGMIVNTHPAKRWKRFREDILEELQSRLEGTPLERVIRSAAGENLISSASLRQLTGLPSDTITSAIQTAVIQNLLLEVEPDQFIASSTYKILSERLLAVLSEFHTLFPLRMGMPREQLRQRVGVKSGLFNALLRDTRIAIVGKNNLIQQIGHEIRFSPEQESILAHIIRILDKNPYSPPGINEWRHGVSEELLRALIDQGHIVVISEDIAYTRAAWENILKIIDTHLDQYISIDAKTLRDLLNTSRKYAIAILEHLDEIGVTRREGDIRLSKKNMSQK